MGFDFLYRRESIDVLAEYYQFDHTNNVGASGLFTASAWFAQLSYKINQDYKVIAGTEWLNFDESNERYFRGCA